jgi:hypothetical protein
MNWSCEETVAAALQEEGMQKLMASLGDSAAPIIACKRCDNHGVEGSARAFIMNENAGRLEVVLCSNRLSSSAEIKEAMTHELVHAYDFIKDRCNFHSCTGLAYTEIRAAREAECKDELSIFGIKKRCVQRKATRSTANLYPNDADRCVKEVLDAAMKDHQPF